MRARWEVSFLVSWAMSTCFAPDLWAQASPDPPPPVTRGVLVTDFSYYPLRALGRYAASEIGWIKRTGSRGFGLTGLLGGGEDRFDVGGKLRLRTWHESDRSVDVGIGAALQFAYGEVDAAPLASVNVSLTRLFSASGVLVTSPADFYVGGTIGSKPGAVVNVIVIGATAALFITFRNYAG